MADLDKPDPLARLEAAFETHAKEVAALQATIDHLVRQTELLLIDSVRHVRASGRAGEERGYAKGRQDGLAEAFEIIAKGERRAS